METMDLAHPLHFTDGMLAREGKQSTPSYSEPGKSLTLSNAILPTPIPPPPKDNFL